MTYDINKDPMDQTIAERRSSREIDGYTIKRHRRYGRYIERPIETVNPGDKLDMGVFVSYGEAMHNGAVNPRTWMVQLGDGTAYVETRGANVRVWIDES